MVDAGPRWSSGIVGSSILAPRGIPGDNYLREVSHVSVITALSLDRGGERERRAGSTTSPDRRSGSEHPVVVEESLGEIGAYLIEFGWFLD